LQRPDGRGQPIAPPVALLQIPFAAMPITLDGNPTTLSKEVQWICDITQDLWMCIPDRSHQSSTRLPIQRPLSVSTPSQDRHQNVMHQMAVKQSEHKTPQPTRLCGKKEASLWSEPSEKSPNISYDRVAVMAELPPLKVMEEAATSIWNVSTREQLPILVDCLTDDTLPIFE